MMITDGLYCALEHVQMGTHGDSVAAEEHIRVKSKMPGHSALIKPHSRRRMLAGFRLRSSRSRSPGARKRLLSKRMKRLVVTPAPRSAANPNGTVTAGNAPGVNDGAGAMVLTSEEWARAHGRAPIAKILSHAAAAWGLPTWPIRHISPPKALQKAGLTVEDMDLFEINEAFANVALISARRLGVPLEKLNVNGGAIALGHPLAASGARILLTLIYELGRRGGGLGLAAICSGGGQGDAIIIEVPRQVANA